MPAYKFTAQRGRTNRADVAITAGTDEAQRNTVSVTIDLSTTGALGCAEALVLIDQIKNAIQAAPYPPL